MNYLDGFSGYGGFHLAFERAGWKFDKCYYSEIDKHAIANYSYNFPNSIYAGSIDTICQSGIITDLDLFTFGWPCQDNSIAGKRKGQQSGTRSGLLYEAVNIIDKFKPRNFVAENVAGLLSVNKGIDIIESFKILSYLNESMPQYDIEMQLLNTRWFLPQNRERLFFIGHLRGSCSRQIFPIGEDFTGVDERAADPAIVRCFTAGGHSGGMHSGMTLLSFNRNDGAGKKLDVAYALSSSDWRGLQRNQNQNAVKNSRINGWHENENIIAAHMGDKKRSTVQEHVYHKPEGILQAMGLAHTPKIINTNMAGQSFENEHAGTLRSGASSNYQLVNNIRRLIPIECERLQGLPDNWTQYGNYDGQVKEISDTQRYRLCGNGVSIPVVQKIAELLKKR